MAKVEPGTPVIYERVNNTVYGRFANRPDIPRWVVTQENITGTSLSMRDFSNIVELSKTNPALKTALDKLALLYNMVKDEK